MGEPIQLRPKPPEPLRAPGCGRDAENERALIFSFSRRVTDDEMRFLHEVVQRACACALSERKP